MLTLFTTLAFVAVMLVFYLLLMLLLLEPSLNQGTSVFPAGGNSGGKRQSKPCPLEKCNAHFGQFLLSPNAPAVERGDNYCRQIARYRRCLSSISRRCRGQINFHMTETLVNRQLDEFDCHDVLAQFPEWDEDDTPVVGCPLAFRHGHRRSVAETTSKLRRRICSLFGAQNLRTFGGAYDTCGGGGAWPMVSRSQLATVLPSCFVLHRCRSAHTYAIQYYTVSITGSR